MKELWDFIWDVDWGVTLILGILLFFAGAFLWGLFLGIVEVIKRRWFKRSAEKATPATEEPDA